jgi:glycosyltransferase involved in cell wall biosynthesis
MSRPALPGNPDVWVVIPAYNEAPRLGETLASLCRSYANVVVVDDGSEDGTGDVALHHPVWLMRHLFNCGQGAALQTGIEFALARGAAILVTFDADGQHAAEDIEPVVEPVRTGRAEVVFGSRFLGRAVGLSWTRWLVLKLGVLFTRVFSRVAVTDAHNGLRALSRHAALQIRITHNRMAHASEILDQVRRRGLPFCEVPVTVRYSSATTAKGQSSWNGLKIVGQLFLGRIIR